MKSDDLGHADPPGTLRSAPIRPRLISPDDVEFIVATATARPATLGCPFTRWSVRKLADYLTGNPVRRVTIGRERLRQILHE